MNFAIYTCAGKKIMKINNDYGVNYTVIMILHEWNMILYGMDGGEWDKHLL